MPSYPVVYQMAVPEDSGCSIMARVRMPDASYITQATTSSITVTYKVKSTQGATSTTTSLTVSAVVFDTLQTGNFWTKDPTGYNFKWTVPADVFTMGGKDYAVTFVVTPTSGAAFKFWCTVRAEKDPTS